MTMGEYQLQPKDYRRAARALRASARMARARCDFRRMENYEIEAERWAKVARMLENVPRRTVSE